MTKNLWANIPIPETFVVGLLLGGVGHASTRKPISRRSRALRLAGLALFPAGFCLIAWAMIAVRDIRIDQPPRLVTDGPYAVSRNPMYIGWALSGVGTSLLLNSRWLLAATIAAGLYHHVAEIPKEERELQAWFPEQYRSYRQQTRRYL